MTKKLCLLLTLFFIGQVKAADLIEVYQQALVSDPAYQQAIAQRLANKEFLPINIAGLLPNIGTSAAPFLSKSYFYGFHSEPGFNSARGYTLTLSATQTVVDFGKFFGVASAVSISKEADATLNAAAQDLMIRVATAYFAILKDEENLHYNDSNMLAFLKQLEQAKQQYQVGLKTITDVYTAEASYESAKAFDIAAKTQLADDQENLRVITGIHYEHLAQLKNNFPLSKPSPPDMEVWVNVAKKQNWTIKAAQYAADSALQIIRQQFSGHLPTANVQATIDKVITHNHNPGNGVLSTNGSTKQIDGSLTINVNLPIFEGGLVIAETNQARYTYQVAMQQLELIVRNTINQARQSYLGVIAGISQITADKKAITSAISSLHGLEASYNVGTETLVDVITQQKNVFQAQTQYATDRYAYINNLLALKQAAGTLGIGDFQTLNHWLSYPKTTHKKKSSHPKA